jgi:hypothetical protein
MPWSAFGPRVLTSTLGYSRVPRVLTSTSGTHEYLGYSLRLPLGTPATRRYSLRLPLGTHSGYPWVLRLPLSECRAKYSTRHARRSRAILQCSPHRGPRVPTGVRAVHSPPRAACAYVSTPQRRLVPAKCKKTTGVLQGYTKQNAPATPSNRHGRGRADPCARACIVRRQCRTSAPQQQVRVHSHARALALALARISLHRCKGAGPPA